MNSETTETKHWVPAPNPDGRQRAGLPAGVYLTEGETVEWTLDAEGVATDYKISGAKAAPAEEPKPRRSRKVADDATTEE